MKSVSNKSIYWILATLVFAYVLIRSVVLSFTIDESMSYYFVTGYWVDEMHSNNHFLNTKLMKLMVALLGEKEWMLRLPNVLSFGLYIYAVSRLISDAANKWMTLFGSVVLLFIPFMLEMFGVARGYGLSAAFSLWAISSYIQGLRNLHDARIFQRNMFLSVLGMGLAIASNLAVMNVLISLFGLIVLTEIYVLFNHRASDHKKGAILVGIFALITSVISIGALLRLQELDHVYFGSETYTQLAKTSAWSFIYFFPLSTEVKYALLVALCLIILFGIVIAVRQKELFTPLRVALWMFIVPAIGWVLEYEFMGSLLPLGRTAMMFLPGLGYIAYTAVNYAVANKIYWKVTVVFAVLLGVGYSANMKRAFNFQEVRPWGFNQSFAEYFTIVKELSDGKPEKMEVEKIPGFRPVVNYYALSRDLNIVVDEQLGVNYKAEFIILFKHQDEERLQNPELVNNYSKVAQDWYSALYVRNDVLEGSNVEVYR